MKKTKIFLSALVALSILAIITLSVCADPEHSVKYELTGPANTIAKTIRYTNESGKEDELTNINIPWSKTITVKGKIVGVGFIAMGLSGNGTYTAKIYVNGTQQAANTSTTSNAAVSYTIQ